MRSGTAETLRRPNGVVRKAFLQGSRPRVLPSPGTSEGTAPAPAVSVCTLPGTLDWRCAARALGRRPGGPLTCQHVAGSGGGGWTAKARTPLVSGEDEARSRGKGLVSTCWCLSGRERRQPVLAGLLPLWGQGFGSLLLENIASRAAPRCAFGKQAFDRRKIQNKVACSVCPLVTRGGGRASLIRGRSGEVIFLHQLGFGASLPRQSRQQGTG